MRRDEIPMMKEVLEQAIRCEATAVASLWAVARISFALRERGIFSLEEISTLFDRDQISPTIPERLRSVAGEAIEHLRKQSLGILPTQHFCIMPP
jgi:hypothetical protein